MARRGVISKWFRLYTEIRDDPKMWELTDLQFRILIGLMCMACSQDKKGSVFGHPSAISWSLRCDRRAFDRAIEAFKKLGIIEQIENGYKLINWEKRQFISDNVSIRVHKYRKKETLHETLHETAPEQNRAEQNPPTPLLEKKRGVELPDWLDEKDWQDFRDHRKKLRKPMTPRAEEILIKKLAHYKDQGFNTRHMIITAIERGWQTVYPPKPGEGDI